MLETTLETTTVADVTTGVVLTESAAQKLKDTLQEKGVADTHALRVFVQGGGCGGFAIENPNATSSCGCGSSFRTSESHTGEEMPESCSH